MVSVEQSQSWRAFSKPGNTSSRRPLTLSATKLFKYKCGTKGSSSLQAEPLGFREHSLSRYDTKSFVGIALHFASDSESSMQKSNCQGIDTLECLSHVCGVSCRAFYEAHAGLPNVCGCCLVHYLPDRSKGRCATAARLEPPARLRARFPVRDDDREVGLWAHPFREKKIFV